eukprot:gene33563-41417_t
MSGTSRGSSRTKSPQTPPKSQSVREVSLCNQHSVKVTNKWFREGLQRRGNYSLQSLDLRGCVNIALDRLQAVFKMCYTVNN